MANLLPSFLDRLRAKDIEPDGIPINSEVNIDASVVNWEFRSIRNTHFQKVVKISNVDIKSGLAFIDCKFQKGIIFDNVSASNFDSSQNPSNFSLLFSNCRISHLSFINNCFFEREILVERESELDRLSINRTQIVNGGLIVNESVIKNLFDVSNCQFDLNIKRSTLIKEFRIETLKGNISLISSKYKKWVKFWNVDCPISFTLNNNIFEDTFDIEASRIQALFIHGDLFEKKALLENRDLIASNPAYLNEIYITDAKFREGFYCNGLNKSIEKVTLPIAPASEGVLKFEGWNVDSIVISGVNQNLKLLFKRMSFRFFLINDFTNYSDISFDKCNGFGDCTLNLSHCDLGATRFNEFDFNSFVKVRIDNVTLDKVKPTNNKWFKDLALEIEVANQTNEEQFKRRREIYRQLKQTLKNNGNYIDSLIFQARELSAYKCELSISSEKTLGNRIIMWINETNDFGLNWIKPVNIVIVFTTMLYLILLPYLSKEIIYSFSYRYSDISNTWNCFCNNLNVFWQLFNPIRQIKLTYGENTNSGWIFFIDLIHRIFLSVMIFQIIKAFRKFATN